MSTPRFNANILAVARRLQDSRATADSSSDTGRRWKSAELQAYENRAIRDMIKDRWLQVGVAFGDLFPELVKTSSTLNPTAGIFSKSSDMWRVTQLFTTDKTIFVDRIPDADVADVIAGRSLIRPTVKRPVFYEERDKVYVLPTTFDVDLIARYIISHPDISVIVGAAGVGNFNTAPGTYTFASRTLVATMNVAFTANDVAKPVMITDDADKVYFGHIETFVAVDTAILAGDGLPQADKVIDDVRVADVEDVTDILFDKEWDSEIQDRMVKMAMLDARENVQS